MAGGSALCEALPWDSRFFGLSIARAVPSRLDAPTRDAMLEWCRSHGTDCLYFLGAPDDTATIQQLDAGGFQLVGVRVTLARSAAAKTCRKPANMSSAARHTTDFTRHLLI